MCFFLFFKSIPYLLESKTTLAFILFYFVFLKNSVCFVCIIDENQTFKRSKVNKNLSKTKHVIHHFLRHAYVLLVYWPIQFNKTTLTAALNSTMSKDTMLRSFLGMLNETEQRVLQALLRGEGTADDELKKKNKTTSS